ncbi:16S rRNA (uracil(1498)-N(3))-methyltransferase [Marinobacter panjinensis]|uniref:Ribosomal RNA small subunit methyltransferase E n=1 Tax=Marinobacter panjinensis TaxID=2576384 RepID=A0A4U6R3Q9_9GAMM|nr:16S rRNA (uracil(1498)-N(3))-methyltransferase [Marinobacter panjinensis]MCR8916114.1 16S rRNA (uracil(1498)-N(3))-methyltransferase [Marinobacter panjinensis]TKV68404.1 16S rRNA (uracil(1498)-N(3))-methyltransferase [Marinobacter panjinensis]
MNLALLFGEDFVSAEQAVLTGRRLAHLKSVLKVAEGSVVPVGLVNGDIGTGHVLQLTDTQATLQVELPEPPPSPLPLTMVLAMPRPKMFRRVLQTCATLGVKDIWLINSYKVEKSFWQTPWLSEENLRENMVLGLEQARDTLMPRVHIRKLFKPFVEDELPALLKNTHALVAHPGTGTPCPVHINAPATLCIGPEGGFIPYEVEKLVEAGCEAVHLGRRILRVETAVPVLVSRLFDACS